MHRHPKSFSSARRLFSLALPLSFVLGPLAFSADLPPDQAAFFETHIRPLLVESCYGCHSVESGKSKGSLLLDSKQGLLKGGDSGPAIVPGDPDASLLLKAATMPEYVALVDQTRASTQRDGASVDAAMDRLAVAFGLEI
ncbi:MAG: hypothetical protein HC841_03440 [Verrucomicrobiae bacterium]|nr:hypothetical protein [Verrucomicrobiae bacterium]